MSRIKKLFLFCYIVLATLMCSVGAQKVEAAPPANFQTTQIIATGLYGPSAFEFAPDGRIFILQRTGEVKVYKNGALLVDNFVTLPSIASGDRGLIGIAFDPDFVNNKYVYFYYTGTDTFNHLVRFNAATDTATGQTQLYQTSSPSEQLHVGGTVRFGPDGKLYFAIGDNGYGPNAQNLSNPHGKIMRINKDGTIPTDNPFYGQVGKLPEIWAYGLRNPWRFVFDSASGKMYDGDVGADAFEEMNEIVKGGNYGWPNCEGKCIIQNPAYIEPLFQYPHNINGVYQSSAITQGPVYHGNMFPLEYQNSVFYGDYSRGIIRRLTTDINGSINGDTDFDMQAGSVVDMKIAGDGSMYYITYYPGKLYRISYSTSNYVPVANASADTLKGTNPFTVNFSSNGSYDPDGTAITYSWNFGDGTTSTSANPTKTFTHDGSYTVELTVSDGVNTALSTPIIIQVGCPPIVTIGVPKDGTKYNAGDLVTVNASAIDCVGFDINDASLSTTVKFHHTTHIHPFLDNLVGRSNSFTVPLTGEQSADTWFEIDVTAKDTNGLSTTAVANIYPNKANLTFVSNPVGLSILMDGQPTITTQTIPAVVGYQREIDVAAAPQVINGKSYVFDHWSDGGAQRHIISTPTTDTTYTAFFKEVAGNGDQALSYTIYDELLAGDWLDYSWDSTNNFASTTSYSGSKALAWTATKGWAGLLLYRNGLPLDMSHYQSVTFALRASGAGQKVHVQFYDQAGVLTGNDIDVANYGGDPAVGVYKVYTIPLTAFGVSTKMISYIHLQNYTETAQPAMYLDRFGFTVPAGVSPTPTPTNTPTPTPTAIPTVTPTPIPGGVNLVVNNSFETTGTNWLTPWKFDVFGTAKGTISRDITAANKTDGVAGAKVNITTPSANGYEAQLYQLLSIKANKQYTVIFDAKSSANRNLPVVFQKSTTPYTSYVKKTFAVTSSWQKYSFTFTPTITDLATLFGFNTALATGNIWIDNVYVCEGTCGTPTPTPTITPTPTPVPTKIFYVFDENLATTWGDWTWSSTINFADTSHPYKGTRNIDWKPNAQWAGFLPFTQAGFNTTGYDSITFAIMATKPNQKINVQLYTFNDVPLGVNTDIAKYGGDPVIGTYKVYSIPLADLDGVNKDLLKFHIQDVSGNAQNEIYLDSVAFIGSGTGGTPTPSPTPAPTPVPAQVYKIYDDALISGWEDWSWSAINNFASVTQINSGTKSISYTATAGYSGLDIHSLVGIDTTPYSLLSVALRASQAGQKYAVILRDVNGINLAQVPLSNYGDPSATAWKVYDIPLATLNAAGKKIYDVVIHEISGAAQPALYIDDLQLK